MQQLDKFNALSNMLESEQFGEECLDFIELHGYLTAAIISPEPTPSENLMPEILGQSPSELSQGISEILLEGVLELRKQLSQELLAANPLQLPCDITIGENDDSPSDLERWCMAFCEKHLLNEEAWFAVDESAVAELMLPIIAASGLFDEEEITSIRANESLFISMLEHIPEVVVDLYGLFHNE